MEPRFTAMTAEYITRALDHSDRFHRDTNVGRIFHPGTISFREISSTDSLHIVIDGNRLSAHVDRISPLKCRNDGSTFYSWTRVVAHNLSGMRGDLAWLLRRRNPNRRASVYLEVVWVDEDPSEPDEVARRLAEHCLAELNVLVEQASPSGSLSGRQASRRLAS